MDIQSIWLLLLTILLVLMNGFFVATEFAIVKVRSTRIKELVDSGSTPAKYAYHAIRHLDAYLSATQLGITLASLGLGWIGEPAIARQLAPLLRNMGLDSPEVLSFLHAFGITPHGVVHTLALAIAFIVITFAHIVIGELAPKSLAIQRAERVVLWVSGPMRVFYWIFRPFILMLNGTANAALKIVGIKPANESDLVHSEEELRMIITASGADHGGTLRETQAELLDNVFDFGHRLARQIMKHRTEIEVLDVEDTLEENVRCAHEGGHTRFPLIQGDIDTVIGFVHTKDLFALYQQSPKGDIRSIMRDVLIVPETIRVDLLLRQLQKKRQHMAVLVDEYGGTAGIITVGDLLEELVGELPDEFEPTEEEWIIPLAEDTWSLDGRLPLTDLEEVVGREISCEEACDTVGGYAYWAFGRIPTEADTVERDGIQLRVLAMDGHRVSRVEIHADPVSDANDEDFDDMVVHGSR